MIAVLPLQGTHLIQASAGTGKTHTLGLLVLRLVLEGGLTQRGRRGPPRLDLGRLAVVTFTEASARELAHRIASFLRSAAHLTPDTDPSIRELVEAAVARDGEQAVSLLLEDALQTVDQARISTIHGFCSRLLREFAFELRAGLGFERLASEDALVEEILADFWRAEIAPLDASLQPAASALSPAELARFLRPLRAFSDLPVRGPILEPDQAQAAHHAWTELQDLWLTQGPALHRFLQTEAPRFKGGLKVVKNLDELWSSAQANLWGKVRLVGEDLGRLATAELTKGLKKEASGTVLPSSALCDAIGRFQEQFEVPDGLIAPALRVRAWAYLQQELPRRKALLRVRSDNDLIAQVDAGLRNNPRAVRAIRSRFSAVLVDEFQDTDDVQNRIFDTLFGEGRGQPLFHALVGDPKQAIYAFRGGDVQAYLAVAQRLASDHRWTLGKNYRSEARYVDALNRVYARVASLRPPLGEGGIDYEAVEAARPAETPLVLDGQAVAPLTLWQADGTGSPTTDVVGRRVAHEILRLRAETGWSASDFAILVSSHETARLLRRELARFGVLAVTGKSGSVLETPEADELELLLQVLAEPGQLTAVRALLLSGLYGWDTERLAAWEADPVAVQATLEELQKWAGVWARLGLGRALNQVLHERQVWFLDEGNLGHQRRVANFRQLIERLHAEDSRLGRQPLRALALYRRWRADPDESFEQELEADEGAVNIVTMHKSKGLQWKVVFAVDLFKDGTSPRNKPAPLRRDSEGRRYADFDPAVAQEVARETARENASERLRLAYVTLTRAERLAYVVVRAPKPDKDPETKPDQWLFSDQPDVDDSEGPLIRREALADLPDLPPRRLPDPEPALRPIRRLNWGQRLVPRWSLGSYTGLTRDLPAHPPVDRVGVSPPGILSFPRGAAAGTALHSVLERVDFQNVSPDRVRQDLGAAGISTPEHQGAVLDLLGALLPKKLLPDDEFSLDRLHRNDRAAEVEFHLTAAWGDRPALTREALQQALGDRIGEIAATARLKGFLFGIIDLVFRHQGRWYIVDWKSNHLGNQQEDYAPEALDRAMRDNHYLLQAHLYTVAWCRHLKSLATVDFNYETDFGGVIYVFLRGVSSDPDSRHGLWFCQPRPEDIATLEGLL